MTVNTKLMVHIIRWDGNQNAKPIGHDFTKWSKYENLSFVYNTLRKITLGEFRIRISYEELFSFVDILDIFHQ